MFHCPVTDLVTYCFCFIINVRAVCQSARLFLVIMFSFLLSLPCYFASQYAPCKFWFKLLMTITYSFTLLRIFHCFMTLGCGLCQFLLYDAVDSQMLYNECIGDIFYRYCTNICNTWMLHRGTA
jgi:hypothetical protein